MCGILALFNDSPLSPTDLKSAQQALDSLSHRGPDAEGKYTDSEAGIYMGHRRLSIIDISSDSNQPMQFGRFVITYNGEIYNYKELRSRLQGLGHEFKTSGDVEVLVHAWAEWGENCLELLDGMYAFAILDGESLFLVSDHFGEKPIFWHRSDKGIVAASELKAIQVVAAPAKDIDEEKLTSYLTLGYFPAPLTAFRNTWKLAPATIVRISPDLSTTVRRYWQPPKAQLSRATPVPLSSIELGRVSQIMIESTEKRLRSDVPMALFLSSGLDSTLIAAIVKKEIGAEIEALTVSVDQGELTSEAPNAAIISRELGLTHRILEAGDFTSNIKISDFVEMYTQPSDQTTSFSLMELSKLARKDYKVGLTGVGGDELFGGYNKHELLYHRQSIVDRPDWLKSLLSSLLTPFSQSSNQVKNLMSQFLVPKNELYPALKNFPAIDLLRTLPGFEKWSINHFGHWKPPYFSSLMNHQLTSEMADEHLITYDHASMRHGFELRTPFLNKKLVEEVANFDPRALMLNGRKGIIRRLAARYVSEKVINLPKRGFNLSSQSIANSAIPIPPGLDLISDEMAQIVWSMKNTHVNWARILLRMATVEYFLANNSLNASLP
jgi:asparagine synthase (glutamine-hydrolysing)